MGWLSVFDLVDPLIKRMPFLQAAGETLRNRLHEAELKGGKPARTLADLLHGTWLGHPLHAVLIVLPIGSWIGGAVFDLLDRFSPSYSSRKAADTLTALGAAAAVPTALAGITDYSTIKKDAASYGMLHGMLNSTALLLYVLSVRERGMDRRDNGLRLSTVGFALLIFSAWLGGDMSYRMRVGVNHGAAPAQPKRWTPVMASEDLIERVPQRVDVGGHAVLLYRASGSIYAIGAVCSHAGGPLEKGKFDGTCVQCPWHDSVFDLRNGQIVHGPSTYHQPAYEARVRGGRIEVRLANTGSRLEVHDTEHQVSQSSTGGARVYPTSLN